MNEILAAVLISKQISKIILDSASPFLPPQVTSDLLFVGRDELAFVAVRRERAVWSVPDSFPNPSSQCGYPESPLCRVRPSRASLCAAQLRPGAWMEGLFIQSP